MPVLLWQGLLMFACVVGDIIERFTGAKFVVLGDVTYGACCVDDLTARAIGCDFLVHYGHSCLVPVAVTNSAEGLLGDGGGAPPAPGAAAGPAEGSPASSPPPLRTLYVFVEISIDVEHLVACVQANFGAAPATPLTVMGTIQFATALHSAAGLLAAGGFTDVLVPQAKPLSPGETLGCTSPRLVEEEGPGGPGGAGGAGAARQGVLVFVADGRFHLEAAMIANPQLAHYRYDPYGKVLTRERYAVEAMKGTRLAAIEAARPARRWGLVLGTLGRQGNPAILGHLRRVLKRAGKKCLLVLVRPPPLHLL